MKLTKEEINLLIRTAQIAGNREYFTGLEIVKIKKAIKKLKAE